jgi:hypothetical protein
MSENEVPVDRGAISERAVAALNDLLENDKSLLRSISKFASSEMTREDEEQLMTFGRTLGLEEDALREAVRNMRDVRSHEMS